MDDLKTLILKLIEAKNIDIVYDDDIDDYHDLLVKLELNDSNPSIKLATSVVFKKLWDEHIEYEQDN